MDTVIRIAQNPNTKEEYKVELPAHGVVRKAILELDYPPEGIRIIEATDLLSEKFQLSDKEKNARKKSGERYLDVFRYDIVAPGFKYLLEIKKLKQPGGPKTPYFLAACTSPIDPHKSIEENYQKIRGELAKELLQRIKDNSPTFFEKLVIDLLFAMGYGGSREDAEAVGRSGDGGIDGIIKADPLGLNVVYVQAKRWSGKVGEPPVRDFVGALDGEGVQEGIFITTSDFNPAAKNYADRSSKRIILINGNQLAQYMIDHNVGVSVEKIYEIKRVDSDYFAEDAE